MKSKLPHPGRKISASSAGGDHRLSSIQWALSSVHPGLAERVSVAPRPGGEWDEVVLVEGRKRIAIMRLVLWSSAPMSFRRLSWREPNEHRLRRRTPAR
jgi:hypothetical protein